MTGAPLAGAFLLFLVTNGVMVFLGSQLLGMALFALLFFLYCFCLRKTLSPYFQNSGFLYGAKCWLIIFPLIFLWSSGTDWITEKLFDAAPQPQVAVAVIKGSLDKPLALALLILFIVVIVPIIEEIIFRGFMQNWLKTYMRSRWAILLTGFIFAAFHFSPAQGASNLTIVSSLFLLGCLLGALLEMKESLWAPIGLHMTFNLMSVLFILWS